MSVLISVPIGMAISQYSNLNHACVVARDKKEQFSCDKDIAI